ncbi:MAG UNVERIFIED_CONTAM: hypothetical protein LVT10_05865 [Anaerolineae bacterium]
MPKKPLSVTGTLSGLQRRLQRFDRWKFLTEEKVTDSVERILHLIVEERKRAIRN